MQLADLRQYLEKASGKAGSRRPVLAQLLADAQLKKFNTVLVWKLDRFGRSLADLVNNIRALDHLGIRFLAPTQGIDTDQRSPLGKLLMHIFAAFAEFERDLIIDRSSAGQAEYRRAYAAGEVGKQRHSRSGKDLAPYRPKRIFRRDEIAPELEVPVTTVRRALRMAA